jgi:hypothetical protein
MRNVLDKSCRESENTHRLFSNFFFRKSHRLWNNVEKYSGDRGATNDLTIWRIRVACWISKATCTYAHAHAHAPGYSHARTHAQACAHRPICNTYCVSTATMVSWTRLIVTSYVHCLSCFFGLPPPPNWGKWRLGVSFRRRETVGQRHIVISNKTWILEQNSGNFHHASAVSCRRICLQIFHLPVLRMFVLSVFQSLDEFSRSEAWLRTIGFANFMKQCSYGNLIYRAGASNWEGHRWYKRPGVALGGTRDQ